jgi:hypothetical protein
MLVRPFQMVTPRSLSMTCENPTDKSATPSEDVAEFLYLKLGWFGYPE